MKCLALLLGFTLACSTDTFTGPDGATADGGSDGLSGDSGGSCETPASCPPNAQCSTFDGTDKSIAPFSNISQNGGNVTFESDVVVTCPQALVAFSAASTATNPSLGGIGSTGQLNIPSAVAHARVELDVILPKNPTGSAAFLFMYPNTDAMHGVGLVWSGGTWLVHNAVTNDDNTISPRTDAWNHIALDVKFSASGGTGMIELDYIDANGKPQTSTMPHTTLSGTVPTVSSITFGAGVIPTGGTSGPMTMHIDDVVFEPF